MFSLFKACVDTSSLQSQSNAHFDDPHCAIFPQEVFEGCVSKLAKGLANGLVVKPPLNGCRDMASMSRAERFEDEKRRIIDSCFTKREPDGACEDLMRIMCASYLLMLCL